MLNDKALQKGPVSDGKDSYKESQNNKTWKTTKSNISCFLGITVTRKLKG